jgi:hypothetical protein
MTPAAKPSEADTIFSLLDSVKKIISAPRSVEMPAMKEITNAIMAFWSIVPPPICFCENCLVS